MVVARTLSWRRLLWIYAVAALLLWLLVRALLAPVRLRLSDRFTSSGDAYFTALDYADAIRQYDHALALNPANHQASADRQMAQAAPADPAQAQPFFAAHHMQAELDKLSRAQQSYPSPKLALAAGVALYDTADYGFARYPLEQAVKLDPGYPEAWNYLGLDYQKLASVNQIYAAKATDAFKRRDLLTPKYIK